MVSGGRYKVTHTHTHIYFTPKLFNIYIQILYYQKIYIYIVFHFICRGTNIEIANLLNVCWLEVHGKINTSLLTPKTKYEVVFVVKMEELSYGWQTPVNLRLLFENGITHEQKVKLLELPRDQRKELKVGEIINSGEKAEEVEISLYEYNGGQWKRGLVIEGVIIRPNK